MTTNEKTTSAGISEFAKLLGVTHSAVHKAIQNGRIPAHLVGTRNYRGRTVAFITDAEAAKVEFLKNTDPVRRTDGARISAGKRAANAELRCEVGKPTANLPGNDNDIPSIAESRAITEAYKAKITKLEYERELGRLVDAEEFKIRFSTMVVAARARLLGVPSKAKGRIPHLTIDDVGVLTELVREALEDLPAVDDRLQALLDQIQAEWWRPEADTETLSTSI